MADGNNVLDYPQMTRQREDNIQAKEIAYAEDVNAEFDYIMDTFNQLVAMLTGEWGDGTGRIYDLVDDAVSLANQALVAAQNCVQKTGDTMTGHLNISLVPASDYNVVNKKYVDDTIDAELAEPINRITTLENWKTNLDATQIKLDNANFSSTNINDGMNELFISVSNGKAIVAAAITGKGVETASDASFKTMADNINAILTFTEGTTGGTATAADIAYGKTAYARGQLLVGTLVGFDTSDATATASDILLGKTAYSKGEKLYGTLIAQAEEGYPTFGTDTSDATATVSDIAFGKTAYARGQKLTGNMNTSLEEIYGLENKPFDINMMNFPTTNPPDGTSKINYIYGLSFSQDGNFCVRWGQTADGENVVESFAINENGLYYQANKSPESEDITYKKYRYTWEELGLVSSDGTLASEITEIAFGCAGSMSKEKICALGIIYKANVSNVSHEYLKIITYHLSDEGIIGKAYDNEDIIDFSTDITVSNYQYQYLIGDLNNPDVFYISNVGYSGRGLDKIIIYPTIVESEIKYNIIKKECNKKISINISNYIPIDLRITEDSKYCYLLGTESNNYYPTPVFIWEIVQDSPLSLKINEVTNYTGITNVISINSINQKTYIFSAYFNSSFYIAELKKNTNNDLEIDSNTIRKISLYPNYTYKYGGIVTLDGKKLITVVEKEKTYIMLVHDLDELLAIEPKNETPVYVEAKQIYTVPITPILYINQTKLYRVFASRDTTKIYRTFPKGNIELYGIVNLRNLIDNKNLIALKYKNQYFSKIQSQTLSAGESDVREGKTFIGLQGYPETGTLEV